MVDNPSIPADEKLIVAITSRALFDMAESHALFESAGLDAFHEYQTQRENDPLAPGIAFPLVQKLLRLNAPKNSANPRRRASR